MDSLHIFLPLFFQFEQNEENVSISKKHHNVPSLATVLKLSILATLLKILHQSLHAKPL